MRPSRFTTEQIMRALRQVKAGTTAVQVCRKLGITQTTFYRWRAKYGAAGTGDGQTLHALREENQNLRQIIGDLLLEKQRASGRRPKQQ
jgi:putative transposase